MDDIDELLYRPIFDEPLPADLFLQQWEEDVGDPCFEFCVQRLTCKRPKSGKFTLYRFLGGLVATEDSEGNWQAWETRERVEERAHYAAWADFARGTWLDQVPKQEGTYPTRDKMGSRARDRILKRVNGRLLDVTCCSGMVNYGQVSNWQGSWYSTPYPRLRGAL